MKPTTSIRNRASRFLTAYVPEFVDVSVALSV
jgi:hypothetical protein